VFSIKLVIDWAFQNMASKQVELIQHPDAYSFKVRVRDFRLRDEALHHAMLSHCYALTHIPEPLKQYPDLLTLESNGEVVAVAPRSGNSVFISMLTALGGVDLLAQFLLRHGALSMVNAPPDVAQRFAQIWTQLTGQPHTHLRIFRIRYVAFTTSLLHAPLQLARRFANE
jgi:hypothetical protein